jgi:alpha-tubulin suppressor-like RCC1 family protein
MEQRTSIFVSAGIAAVVVANVCASCSRNMLTVGSMYDRHDASQDEGESDATPAGSGGSDGGADPTGGAGSAHIDVGRADGGDPAVDDANAEASPLPEAGAADGDAADACAANACAGCGALSAAPGDPCGQCGSYACSTDGASLICVDPGTVTQASAGLWQTCVILATGGLRCWGGNTYGELGNGTSGPSTDTFVPPKADLLPAVRSVTGGRSFTCAVLATGGVRCWGFNMFGQLDGIGTDKLMPADSDVVTGAVAVATGEHHACALLETGGVRCWGSNEWGQVGPGTPTTYLPRDISVTGVKALVAGSYHNCALLDPGVVRCWGDNEHGQLGDGTTAARATADVDVPLPEVRAIAAGNYHTCAVLKSGGVRCWGTNYLGALGDGVTSLDNPNPSATDIVTDAVAITAFGFHTCALLSTGAVRCWGENYDGELGDGITMTNELVPNTAVVTGAVAITTGGIHTCAIVASGRLQCWGGGGAVGAGPGVANFPLPVDVMGFCP